MPVHSIKNPKLKKFKTAIEEGLDPEMKEAMEPIIVSGMKILYSDSTHPKVLEVYDGMKQDNFAPDSIANGIANLIGMIFEGSQGKMPLEPAVPASLILACYVMEDLEVGFGMPISDEVIKAVVSLVATKIGDLLDPEGLHEEAKAAGVPGQEGQPAGGQPQPAPQQPAGAAAPQPGMVM